MFELVRTFLLHECCKSIRNVCDKSNSQQLYTVQTNQLSFQISKDKLLENFTKDKLNDQHHKFPNTKLDSCGKM